MAGAYYNEFDPFAAQWLRNLIAAGHIAPGVVDERSIVDVRPDELAEFVQCHFFAGIGIWSYALRQAGWPDDRPVWTGSCPCQPFSVAGKRAALADERHLWPAWFRLVEARRPVVLLGEQVASQDALAWFDDVCADLDSAGYTGGGVDTCAAGFGAPHIRQRIYWMAHTMQPGRSEGWAGSGDGQTTESGGVDGLADTSGARSQGNDGAGQRAHAQRAAAEQDGETLRVADPNGQRQQGQRLQLLAGEQGSTISEIARGGEVGGLGNTEQQRTGRDTGASTGAQSGSAVRAISDDIGSPSAARRPGPTNGHWRDADWLFCRDGKWRPVEPGTFPLVDGATGRVGRLRAYGNGLCAAQAAGFIEAVMEELA